MTLRTRRRCLHELLALGSAAALPGCATIIHPERQGNDKGPIDVAPLLLDILWFIPGLIPGIIALAVDFGTGAIFLDRYPSTAVRGTDSKDDEPMCSLAIVRGEQITVRAPEPEHGVLEHDHDIEIALRLLSPHGAILDEARGHWGSTRREPLTVAFATQRADELGDGRLQLQVRRGTATHTAAHPLRLCSDWDVEPSRRA